MLDTSVGSTVLEITSETGSGLKKLNLLVKKNDSLSFL